MFDDPSGRIVSLLEVYLNPAERMSLYWQLTALLAAAGFYLFFVRRHPVAGRPVGLLRWILPRDVLLHPSAVTDYLYFVISRLMRIFIYAQVFTLIPVFTLFFIQTAQALLGPPPDWDMAPSPLWVLVGTVVTTLVMALILDLALWFAHWIFHVVPELWEFHKVHHSAEVLTPITAARMHPVEEIIDTLIAACALGFGYTLMYRVFGPVAIEFTQFEVNVVVLGFYLAAFNLRHSHVFLRYPNWIQHIFISPAQHQVHHSVRPEHWNRNMGFIFALWDWAAGTLVSPKRHEQLQFGLGTREDGTWHGVGTLYLRPFRQAASVLLGRFRRSRPGSSPREG